MRKLGAEYGIVVPTIFNGPEHSKHYNLFLLALATAAGGYTETPAQGGWSDKRGLVREPVFIVTTRANEFDYAAYSKVERLIHDFSRYMLTHGEIEVMRWKADKVFMQHATDK